MATPATGNVEQIISVKFDARQAISGLTSLNEQIAQNSKELSDMAKAGEKGTKAYADLEQETKALKTQKRDLSQMVQNEIKQQTTLDGSLRSMRAELSNLTKQYDALSKAERENVNVGGKLKNQINQVTTEIKAAEEGTQRYYRNVGNYQNAILNALGINGRFGQSILGLTNMQGGFSGAMASMGASVKAFGASLMALMSNPVFLAIAGIAGVGMAFKWFYDYNVEIEHAMRITKEFVDVSGDELIHLRAEIEATASTYGKEYQEVLEGVDLLMSHFGLTSEEAIRTLNDGFRIGADINGNYLQLLKQYGPVLKDAGVSASQLVSMIQQTRSGIFSQQGLEAIKQAAARIREMSTGTRQALQGIGIDVNAMQDQLRTKQIEMVDAIKMVSDKLKEVGGNTQEYGDVMADVFGKQGKFSSQEMIESLGDIETNIDALIEASGEYGAALDENQKATADLEEETARLFGTGENGWETLKTRADTFWKVALTNVIKKIRDTLRWFAEMGRKSNVFRYAAQTIAGVIGVLSTNIVDVFRNIGAGFKAIGAWVDAFVTTFKSAFGIIKSLGVGVGDILSGNVSKGIDEIQQGISKGITNALKGLNTALKETRNAAKATFTPFMRGWDAADAFFDNYTGGGGGASGSWGNDTRDLDYDDDTSGYNNSSSGSRNRNGGGSRRGSNGGGGSRNRRTGSGSSRRNSSSNRSGSTTEKESKEQEKLNQLIAEANKMRMKALEEEAKTNKKKVDELIDMQKQAIIDKYGTLEDLQKKLNNAQTDAQTKQINTAIEGYNGMMQNLEAKRKDMKDAIDNAAEEEQKKREEKAKALAKQLAQLYLETSKEGSQAQLFWQLDLLDKEEEAELAAAEESEELKNAIILKYQQKREQMQKDFEAQRKQREKEAMLKDITDYQAYAEAMLASFEDADQRNLQWRLNLLQSQMVQELAMYENNEVMQAAIREKYAQLELQTRREHTQAVIAIEQEKYNAIGSIVGGLGEIMGAFGEQNKEMLVLQKTLALAEIMISQAVAIANAVKAGSNAVTPWQMIAQIASSVVAVTTAMAQAFKALDQAKFATGGYVRGAGTSTSDSIPVRVSNGESIMNAETTAMFGGLLSSLNQLGGGVPIQVQETAASVRGEDMLARAVARGVAMLPNPVVSVEDINRGQRQVEVMNERATL